MKLLAFLLFFDILNLSNATLVEIPELDEFSDNLDVVLIVYWKVSALCMFVDAGDSNDICTQLWCCI